MTLDGRGILLVDPKTVQPRALREGAVLMAATVAGELVRMVAVGSVHDGKRTLVGRLIGDRARDGTERRPLVLLEQRDAASLAATTAAADVVVVLVDARSGVVAETRRHLSLAALLDVRHVVACINKMDLVDWSQSRAAEVTHDLHALAAEVGLESLTTIPVSALHGDNVTHRSTRMPWYDDRPLREHLEQLDLPARSRADRLRLPIQWVSPAKDGHGRRCGGQVTTGGAVCGGDAIVALPSMTTTTITAVEARVDGTSAPLTLAVELADDVDISRGDLLVKPDDVPPAVREIDATLSWLAPEPVCPGAYYALQHASATVRTTIHAVHGAADAAAKVTLRTGSPIFADPYAVDRTTGAFTLLDEHTHDIVAAGVITAARDLDTDVPQCPDVTWHPSDLARDHRWRALSQRGATVWLTGLPASGKSTIAVALERWLVERGQAAYLLDGDNLRHGLSNDLGFTPCDRSEHIRRVGHVARLFADAGVVAVVSLVSPLAQDRAVARRLHAAADLPFIEVHVDATVQECARRDPKGLYERAFTGRLTGFTGVDAPYEPPANRRCGSRRRRSPSTRRSSGSSRR